jgi:Succinate dehydrogenase/fumarate reductase, Fe-S protein subunit
MCGLCYSACPTNATDLLYLGPQALTRAYRFIADSRDSGHIDRIMIVDRDHGVWNCHFAGSCSDVCPKGVDPAFAIQQLKALALLKGSQLKNKIPSQPVEKARDSVAT